MNETAAVDRDDLASSSLNSLTSDVEELK